MRRAEAALDRIDPRVLLAVAVAASGILLLVLLSHLSFFGDDWDPLLFRRGFNLDVLLRPHAEHILLGPTLIYKGIQATIGMEKLLPYAVVSTASFLASVVLLFVYLRRRVDQWLALAGVLPVLFMGTASEVLLWPFEVSFTASMAAGIGALLTLERGDQPEMRSPAVSWSSRWPSPSSRSRSPWEQRSRWSSRAALVTCLRHRRPDSCSMPSGTPAGDTRPRARCRSTTSSTARCTCSTGSPRAPLRYSEFRTSE